MVTGTVEVVVPEPEPPALLEPPEPPAADELPELLVLVAAAATCESRPSTVVPSGICTVTCSPSTASYCLVASRLTVATSSVEVVCRIAWAEAPPPADPEAAEDAAPLPVPAAAPAALEPALLLRDFEPPVAGADPLARPPELLPVRAAELPPVRPAARSSATSARSRATSASNVAVVVLEPACRPDPG